MTDAIIDTRVLLEHIQGLRGEMTQRFDRLEKKVDRLEIRVERGFEEAQEDRQGIHEDLDAVIRKQAKHDYQIAVLTGGPMPEDY